MAKLVFVLCVLLFSTVLCWEIPSRWANLDFDSPQAEKEQFAQEVFGRSWDQFLKDYNDAQNSKRDTISSPLCTMENSAPDAEQRQLCNDGNSCTGADICKRDSNDQPACIGSNEIFSRLGKTCASGGDNCNQGTCVSDDGTEKGNAHCLNPQMVVCDTPATQCSSATSCDAVNGGCTKVKPINNAGTCTPSGNQNGCMDTTAGTCNNGVCQYKPDANKIGATCTTDTPYAPSNVCEDENKGKCVANGVCNPGGVYNTGSCTPTGTQNGCMDTSAGSGVCSNGACTYQPDEDKLGDECDVEYSTENVCEEQNKGKCVSAGVCSPGGVYNTDSCTPTGTQNGCMDTSAGSGVCNNGACTYQPDEDKLGDECDVEYSTENVCEEQNKGKCVADGVCNPGGIYNTDSCTPTGTQNGCMDTDALSGVCNNGACTYQPDEDKLGDECDVEYSTENVCEEQNKGKCVTDGVCSPGGVYNTDSCTPTGPQNGCMDTDALSGVCSNGACTYQPDEDKLGDECDVEYSTENVCEEQNKGKCVSAGVCSPGGVYNTDSCTPTGPQNGCMDTSAGSGVCNNGACTYRPDEDKLGDECDVEYSTENVCEEQNKGKCVTDGVCNPGGIYNTDSCTPTGTQNGCMDTSAGSGVCSNGACTYQPDITKIGETCTTPYVTFNQCEETDKGICQPTGGICLGGGVFKASTATCDDGVGCTINDHCDGSGTCVGGGAKPCPDATTCKYASTCSGAGICSTPENKPTSFQCLNGNERDLKNRCEYNTAGFDPLRCNNQPCIKDDSPTPVRVEEGFCNCWSGWKGQQCEGYATTGPSENPNALGVGKDAFDNGALPPAVDSKTGEFSPKVDIELGTRVTIKVSVPSSQNKWNKPSGVLSYSTTTLLQFEKPVQYNGIPSVPTSKRDIPIADSAAIHNEFGTIGEVVLPDQKRALDSSNPKACNYPNNYDWEIQTKQVEGKWVDIYSSTLSYNELAACGLTYVGYDKNYAFFNGTIKINRNFFLDNDRFHFDRIYSVEQDYAVQFPRNLRATTKVLVSNNTVEFWSAVTQINFNPVSQKWTITISTSVNKPYYKLKLIEYPAMDMSTKGPFPNDVIRDWNKVSEASGSDCNNYAGGDCTQQFTFETHSCDAIDITEMKLKFKAVCRQNGTPDGPDQNTASPSQCAYPNLLEEYPVATVDIHTGSTCPVHTDFSITGINLFTYSSNSYSVPKTLFGISEEMYAAVDFVQPPALLKHVQVVSVCAFPRSMKNGALPTSDCPADRRVSVVTTDAPKNPGDAFPTPHKIVFHFNAGELKALAKVATDIENVLDIQVDLKLTYTGSLDPTNPAKRSSKMFSRMFTVTSEVTIEEESKTLEIAHDKSDASVATFGFLLVMAFAILL